MGHGRPGGDKWGVVGHQEVPEQKGEVLGEEEGQAGEDAAGVEGCMGEVGETVGARKLSRSLRTKSRQRRKMKVLEAPVQRQSLWMWSKLSWRGAPALSDLFVALQISRPCGRFWPAGLVDYASLWTTMRLSIHLIPLAFYRADCPSLGGTSGVVRDPPGQCGRVLALLG